MNVVIVAGGLQTRFKELSCFPKILLPSMDGTPIIMKYAEYFKDQNTITVVVNKKYYNMVYDYVKTNNLQMDVVSSDNANGSFNTIVSCWNHIPKKNVLFFWSDILFNNENYTLDKKVDTIKDDCVVFTTNDKKFRYKVEDGKIINVTSSYDGNVPGIFYIKNIYELVPSPYKPVPDNTDLVDVIKQKAEEGMITITESKIDTTITEYKSLEDYKNIINLSRVSQRFPTDVDINYTEDDKMYCTNTPDKFEYWKDWTSVINHSPFNRFGFVGDIKDDGEVMMLDNLEGYDNNYYLDEDYKNALITVVDDLQHHYINIPLGSAVRYVFSEFYSKPIKAVKEVSSMLINYNFNKLQQMVDTLVDEILNSSSMDKFVLTHGNINPANIFYNRTTKDIKLINPISRSNGLFYSHSLVDFADFYMTINGIYLSLRCSKIYLSDELLTIPYIPGNAVMSAAVILRMLQTLTWYKHDVMKLNYVYDSCLHHYNEFFTNKNKLNRESVINDWM